MRRDRGHGDHVVHDLAQLLVPLRAGPGGVEADGTARADAIV